jgi:iron complex outermembrane recepter protein
MMDRRTRIGVATAVVGLLCASADAQRMQITVTGSNIIPDIEGETSLPVQVITREQIDRANVQTAAELMSTVSANMSFGAYSETESLSPPPGSPGFAGASLRGLGQGRTLVLLNGRRAVSYAFAGGGGFDLNAIPVAAIERVEVLKDGASAIYGSDAIAGVVNFILRKDYRGAQAYAQYSSPQHTGGYSTHYNATAGYGDLASQSFNAFMTVDYQSYGGVRARDRPFASTVYIPGEGVDQTSGNSFPGNVVTPAGTRNPTGDPNNGYANPACLPPFSHPTVGAPRQCRFDGGTLAYIVDPSERLNVTGAVAWRIDADNEFFLQALYARNNFTFAVQPAPVSNMTLPPTSAYYPHAFAQFFGIGGQPLSVRWRTFELGLRTDAATSEQWDVVAGMQGVLHGWNYDGALLYSQSHVDDRYVDGYAKASALLPILNSGLVNPFGFNTPDVVALMSTAKLDQTVRTGKGTHSSVDVHASNEIYPMPAGPLVVAAGAEARQWKLEQISSAVLQAIDVVGGFSFASPSWTASRNVWAVFTEANVPIVKTLEANAAVRLDHYSDFGSTTNPKLSLRWQPASTFVLRASLGKGFRAPALDEVYVPPIYRTTPATNLNDPLRCPVTNAPQDCNTALPINVGGNPLLRPEKSTQWGVGGVWSPAPGTAVGLDYYDIRLKNAIIGFGTGDVLAQCPDGINGAGCPYIHRGPADPRFPNLPGPIVLIDVFGSNIANTRVSGIDLNGQITLPKLDWGRLTLAFQGTYQFDAKLRIGNAGYVNYIDHEMSPGVFTYWRHYLAMNWDYGPWSATLTDNFQKGTYDEAPSATNGTVQRRIGDYDIWNVSAFYKGFVNWTLSAGIKNLFDRNPPFSIQLGTNSIGYDPTYTDPRGRLFWAGVKYAFK